MEFLTKLVPRVPVLEAPASQGSNATVANAQQPVDAQAGIQWFRGSWTKRFYRSENNGVEAVGCGNKEWAREKIWYES